MRMREVKITFTTAGPSTEIEVDLPPGHYELHSIAQEVSASAGGATTHSPAAGKTSGYTAADIHNEIFVMSSTVVATKLNEVLASDARVARYIGGGKLYYRPGPDAGTITGTARLNLIFHDGDYVEES